MSHNISFEKIKTARSPIHSYSGQYFDQKHASNKCPRKSALQNSVLARSLQLHCKQAYLPNTTNRQQSEVACGTTRKNKPKIRWNCCQNW